MSTYYFKLSFNYTEIDCDHVSILHRDTGSARCLYMSHGNQQFWLAFSSCDSCMVA